MNAINAGAECPYCGQPLEYYDTFGRLCAHQDGKILGYIYKCQNENCKSELFNYCFHDYAGINDDTLKEGYPC